MTIEFEIPSILEQECLNVHELPLVKKELNASSVTIYEGDDKPLYFIGIDPATEEGRKKCAIYKKINRKLVKKVRDIQHDFKVEQQTQ